MIRIIRGQEPPQLPAARESGLTAIRDLLAENRDYQVKTEDIRRGYKCAARLLREAQGGKCCYCEKPIEPSHNDVEHYRPKTQYWWLAWTWENLLFSCRQCNQPPNKHDKFLLTDESTRLRPEEVPPGDEMPLLLDPAGSGDPLDSIEFRPFKIVGQTRWIPVGKDDGGRGPDTIRILGLDRDGLREHYISHINNTVRPRVARLLQVIKTKKAKDIQRTWNRLVRSFLRQDAPFAALSYDFLAHKVPAEVREQWRLELPRPPFE